MIDRNQLTQTQLAIVDECDRLALLLIEKNRQYGNSALEPIRVFSKAGPLEQLNVRMDDKLSRIASGQLDDNEDPEMDLAGYLILKSIARKRAWATAKDSLTVAAAENSYLDKLRALRHGREGSSGYVVPPVDDGDDDPVVHVVPDKSSRATRVPDVVCTACGNRFFSASENGLRILETGVCFVCKDLGAGEVPVQMPDECLGALCGRMKR